MGVCFQDVEVPFLSTVGPLLESEWSPLELAPLCRVSREWCEQFGPRCKRARRAAYAKAIEHASQLERTASERLARVMDKLFCGELVRGVTVRTRHDAAALSLALMSNTQRVFVAGSMVEDDGAVSLARAVLHRSCVTRLDLSYNQVGTKGASLLGQAWPRSSFLEEVDLSGNALGDEGAKALADGLRDALPLRPDAGRNLDLRHASVGPEGCAHLCSAALNSLAQLWNLDIGGNPIGDRGGKALGELIAHHRWLKNVNATACELGDDAAHKLGEALTQNVSLGKLNVSRNSIGDFTGFSRGLAQNSTLQELIAGGNRVGEAGGEAFGEALAGNVALKRLELRSTSLGPCGTSWLASGLLTNGALRFLGLAESNLGDEGAEAMGKVLEHGRTPLEGLDVSWSGVGVQGARGLGRGLGKSATLKSLRLKGNKVGKEGAEALGEGLGESLALESLDIADNSLECEGGEAIARGIKSESSLKMLVLDRNRLGVSAARELGLLLERRKHLMLSVMGALA